MGNRAELLFNDLRNALHQILEKIPAAETQDGGKKAPESTHQIVELEGMLQKEREGFEVVFNFHESSQKKKQEKKKSDKFEQVVFWERKKVRRSSSLLHNELTLPLPKQGL